MFIQASQYSAMIRLLLFLWPMLLVPIAMADALSLALQDIDKGRYEQAFTQLEPLAKQGNSEAQYLIGHMLVDDVLPQKDQQKGVYWLEKAVQNRHVKAAQTLSKMYLSGTVVALDEKKGKEYLQLANEYRDPEEPEEECD